MKSDIAIVTFVYNEIHQLPRWIRYYSKQTGDAAHLYVIDHGSDDGSTENLQDVNVIRLDRQMGFGEYQKWRVEYVSEFVNDLLSRYRTVIYADCDEYVMVDPSVAPTLVEYVRLGNAYASHAIGFDVLHDFKTEPPLKDNLLSIVRNKMQFVAAVCKPVLVDHGGVRWSQGFHISTMPPKFGDLFLFHLRYADLDEGKYRLGITRKIERHEMKNVAVDHHKITDETYEAWLSSWLKYPISEDDIGLGSEIIKNTIESFNFAKSGDGMYAFNYSFRSQKLFRFPERFRGMI